MVTIEDVKEAINKEIEIAGAFGYGVSKRMTYNPSWGRYSVWHGDKKIELTTEVGRALCAYNGIK